MKLRSSAVLACSLFLASGLAFGAGHSKSWQQGVVRDVTDNYDRVAVVKQHGDLGLVGKGQMREFCTVEMGDKLYFGERDVEPGAIEHTRFAAVDSSNVAVRLKNGTMTLKDANGHRQSFQILRTLPNTPENEPDPTAFAVAPLVIQ
jgi:hypothetical protein